MHAARNKLITEHLEIATAIAKQCAAEFDLHSMYDDLVGYAYQGLVEAADRYASEHGTKFNTFCWSRVRGAVIDGIRKFHFGRARLATEESNWPVRTERPVETFESHYHLNGEEAVEARRTRVALLRALENLPDKQRAIAVRRHCGNELLRDIAKDLGVYKRHAVRLHSKAINNLRSALAEPEAASSESIQ